MELQTLSLAIESIVDHHGADACLNYCNAVYQSMYKTDHIFTAKDEPELRDSMISMASMFLATKMGKITHEILEDDFSQDCDCYDEFECDCYDYCESTDHSEVIAEFNQQATELVDAGLEFTEIVNYKGEGEGFDVPEAVKHLKLYVNKYNYI